MIKKHDQYVKKLELVTELLKEKGISHVLLSHYKNVHDMSRKARQEILGIVTMTAQKKISL